MRGKEEIRKAITSGQAILGIELGSTRIKAGSDRLWTRLLWLRKL